MCEDINGDGKTIASLMTFFDVNGLDSGAAVIKLRTQMESAKAMIVITGDGYDAEFNPKYNFVNLEKLFPDNPHISEYRFYLKDTDFAQKIGSKETIDENMYIAIRKIRNVKYDSHETMTKAYNDAQNVLTRIIEDLTK